MKEARKKAPVFTSDMGCLRWDEEKNNWRDVDHVRPKVQHGLTSDEKGGTDVTD